MTGIQLRITPEGEHIVRTAKREQELPLEVISSSGA
jgi:hypothetical protein